LRQYTCLTGFELAAISDLFYVIPTEFPICRFRLLFLTETEAARGAHRRVLFVISFKLMCITTQP
jgi:hypothetical protein